MNLREAMCESLVDGWEKEWIMRRAVSHAWRLTGKTASSTAEKYDLACKAVNCKHLDGSVGVRTWVKANMRLLDTALWSAKSRAECLEAAKKCTGGRRLRTPFSLK